MWIIYHAIDVNRPRQRQEDEINSRRILLIDRIEWRDGWPFVGTPSEGSAGRAGHLGRPAAATCRIRRHAAELRPLRLQFFEQPLDRHGGCRPA